MPTFSYDGAVIQTYTAPTSGIYDITAFGAQGGREQFASGVGGQGAEVTGEIFLTAGEQLDILVGGEGGNTFGSPGGGGGGGSFVVEISGDVPLVVAGGGGGSGDNGASGGAGLLASSGNTAGGGGGTFLGGGGGGGFAGNGATADGSGGVGGASFVNGGAGGAGFDPSDPQGAGGFGGGGGAGFGGGGGGGYFGGAGGSGSAGGGGGGGGSFVTASALSESSFAGVETGNGLVTIDPPCYALGTLIRTARGDVAVEHLRIGDLAVTASGASRPIKWIGHRTVDCRKHPEPLMVRPVRIAAHAFGASKPARDLLVSPGHALCIDVVGEVLIPTCALVNGATIAPVEVDSITYWHVELDSHDILLAEGLPAESYADCGNRSFFVENETVSLGAVADIPPDATRNYCRPFHADGALVAVVRERLAARACEIGWRLAPSDALGGLYLLVDGARIDPAISGLRGQFSVPAGARDVWLVSTAARPYDIGRNQDQRWLGVCLAALVADDGFERRVIALDDPHLETGFHAVETTKWRWTDGRAKLPSALWEGSDGDFFLCVDLAAEPLPRWVAPRMEEPASKEIAEAA